MQKKKSHLINKARFQRVIIIYSGYESINQVVSHTHTLDILSTRVKKSKSLSRLVFKRFPRFTALQQ